MGVPAANKINRVSKTQPVKRTIVLKHFQVMVDGEMVYETTDVLAARNKAIEVQGTIKTELKKVQIN